VWSCSAHRSQTPPSSKGLTVVEPIPLWTNCDRRVPLR
jgi:hypothetical protein